MTNVLTVAAATTAAAGAGGTVATGAGAAGLSTGAIAAIVGVAARRPWEWGPDFHTTEAVLPQLQLPVRRLALDQERPSGLHIEMRGST